MFETKVSVFLVTLNEAGTIADAIKSVSQLDEVIVVDSGSTDGTVEIAQRLGATVVHKDWLGFSKQKDYALSLCRNQWCFNLDGDEVVSPQVLQEIRQLVETQTADVIRVPFEDIFMGQPMHPKAAKRSIVRVFNKEKAFYPKDRLVHENLIVQGTEIRTRLCIEHFGYETVEKLVEKQNKYSSLGALQKQQRNKKASKVKLAFVFPLVWFKSFILRRHFLSGTRGFIHSNIDAMYAFLKEAKLYEHNYIAKQKDD